MWSINVFVEQFINDITRVPSLGYVTNNKLFPHLICIILAMMCLMYVLQTTKACSLGYNKTTLSIDQKEIL